jgi:hypothetical protein
MDLFRVSEVLTVPGSLSQSGQVERGAFDMHDASDLVALRLGETEYMAPISAPMLETNRS